MPIECDNDRPTRVRSFEQGGCNSTWGSPTDTTRRSVLRRTGIVGSGVLGAGSGCVGRLESNSETIPPDTDIVLHPSPFSEMIGDLGEEPSAWDTVRENITSIQWHMHPDFHDFTTDMANEFCSLLSESGTVTGVEVVGPSWSDEPWEEGLSDRAVQRVTGHLQTMQTAGCEIDYINIDGPFKTSVTGTRPELDDRGFETFERAAQELVDFVAEMRDRIPDLRVRVIPNFPNWGWRGAPSITPARWGDYQQAFDAMVDAFEARNVKIEGIVVDHPYEYEGRERLFELRDEVRDRDLEFHMIVNSQQGGETSDELFVEQTHEYLVELQDRDLDPDGYTVESWYQHPQRNVPEHDETTMTGLLKNVLELRGDV